MDWHANLVGAMAWSVLALTLGGSSLLYLLIQRGAATAVTSLLYLVPPCTAVMAWLLFGEAITAADDGGHGADGVGVASWCARRVREPAVRPSRQCQNQRHAEGVRNVR